MPPRRRPRPPPPPVATFGAPHGARAPLEAAGGPLEAVQAGRSHPSPRWRPAVSSAAVRVIRALCQRRPAIKPVGTWSAALRAPMDCKAVQRAVCNSGCRSQMIGRATMVCQAAACRSRARCHAVGKSSLEQASSRPVEMPSEPSSRRRHLLAGLAAAAAAVLSRPALAAAPAGASGGGGAQAAVRALQASQLEQAAAQAYADRDFDTALGALDELLRREPGSLRWQEMRCGAVAGGAPCADWRCCGECPL